MINFFPYFFIEFRRFFINQNPLVFFFIFSSNLGSFFTNWSYNFLLSFLLGWWDFFLIKAMISNATCLSELASKRNGNYNVMRSHNSLNDRFNLIRTILYYNLFQGWSLINPPLFDLPNLLSQLFKSIFWLIYTINFLNQSNYNWYSGATYLWYVAFLNIYT